MRTRYDDIMSDIERARLKREGITCRLCGQTKPKDQFKKIGYRRMYDICKECNKKLVTR